MCTTQSCRTRGGFVEESGSIRPSPRESDCGMQPPLPGRSGRSRSIALLVAAVAIAAGLLTLTSRHRVSSAASGASAPITLAVVNARVWTGDSSRPWADGLAARGDRLALVGSSAEVQKLVSPGTRVIDAHGAFVTPGFIDSHVHFVDGGFSLTSVKLRDASTRAEFIHRLKVFAASQPPGTWILEGDWDHTLWGGELPEHNWIDSVTTRNPVWISRLDGHMGLANQLALAQANVTAATPDVAGGTIVRNSSGAPTGILKDNAQSLIERAIASPPNAAKDAALDAAMTYVAEQGVTSVVNMGYSWDDFATFERARTAGRLKTRIYAVAPLATWAELRDTIAARGRGDSWVRIGGLKAFVDGSLGSHTAAMLAPFTDAPHDTGLLVTPPESLYARTLAADRAGLQVMVHAIGDRAIRIQLDIFQRVAQENGSRDRRFRIEHAQHIAPTDLPRFAAQSVIASMQPYHAIDDGRWAEAVIGPERAKTTYAFRSLLDTHARVAFGSDWDVAPATPLEGIYAAVTRRTLDGAHAGGWVPAQKITVEEALRAYTSTGAYAEFQESEKGTLITGKLADFVLIDRDLTTIPPEMLREAHVVMTVVGGRVVYER
jgi:predicted amidohydrolase YtcJ